MSGVACTIERLFLGTFGRLESSLCDSLILSKLAALTCVGEQDFGQEPAAPNRPSQLGAAVRLSATRRPTLGPSLSPFTRPVTCPTRGPPDL